MLDLQAVFGYSDVATVPDSPQAATPAEAPEGPAFDFSGWVPTADVNGRIGMEAPDLPDSVAWWRRTGFDDLPEPVWPGYLGDPRRTDCHGGTFSPATTCAGSPVRNAAAA